MSANSRCGDWVFSNTSNVHVARDRSWFTSYTPFETYFTNYIDGSGTAAKGIGSVELKVETDRAQTGAKVQQVIVLHDVLHVPNAICNIFGYPRHMQDKKLKFYLDPDGATIKDASGDVIALFQVLGNGPYLLKLSPGQASSQSRLRSGMYVINARWPASERQKWHDFKNQSLSSSTGHMSKCTAEATPNAADAPPYTAEEKAWLKKYYGGEFELLRRYGLSIYKEEHREEGRRIARTLMKDGDEDDDEYAQEEEGEDSSLESDSEDEFGPADYMFSEEERDWIKRHYATVDNFLASYGLEFYDHEDLEQGQELVQCFMKEDTSAR